MPLPTLRNSTVIPLTHSDIAQPVTQTSLHSGTDILYIVAPTCPTQWNRHPYIVAKTSAADPLPSSHLKPSHCSSLIETVRLSDLALVRLGAATLHVRREGFVHQRHHLRKQKNTR